MGNCRGVCAALSLSSVIKWILCLIGGLPLLQTLAITFTGAPIPFGKIGGFPPKALQDIITAIENAIKNGKSWLNGLKDEFTNPLKDALDHAGTKLDEFTKDGFERLKTSLPALYSNTSPTIVQARDRLETVLGYAQSQKLLGMTVNQWSNLGNTLYDATQSFKNHTDQLSNVQADDKVLTLETIYGNVVFSGVTANIASSNVATINLSQSVYPTINIGEVVKVDSELKTVTRKTYTGSGGIVFINTGISNTTLYTANVLTFNLANVSIGSSNLKLKPGMYINVNSEIKQVNTINALGDFLTVYSPFRNSNANTTLLVENGFVVNTAFSNTKTDVTVAVFNSFMANSLCLSNVITGRGTTFTSSLTVGDKIYYDEMEYFVVNVTDTEITVDEPLRLLDEQSVRKVIGEEAVMRFLETNNPDDVLAMFDEITQLTSGMPTNILDNLTTRYRKSDGTYATIDISKPSNVVSSLKQKTFVNAVTRTIQTMLDDLQDDAIRFLTETELFNFLNEKTEELETLRKGLMDSIEKDLAAINALKGLLKGLLKLFIASCSKKKKGNDPENPDDSSDLFLGLVTKPNATRQGCFATESDLAELLDDADEEYRQVDTPDVNTNVPTVDTTLFDDGTDGSYPLQPFSVAEGQGDVGIDGDPSDAQPEAEENPCVKPC
jgi:RNA polymerase-interacting CarD/CdnL/TRCF family regulator